MPAAALRMIRPLAKAAVMVRLALLARSSTPQARP